MKPKNFKIKCSFERNNTEGLSEQDKKLQKIADAVSHPIDFELAYMHGSSYKEIFGTTLKGSDRRKRFIKITNTKTKKSVYRIFKGVPSVVKSEDTIYLDSDGYHVLTDTAESTEPVQNSVELSIKKTNWLAYYWNTSNTMVRITFKIGAVSLALGIISLILSVVSILGNF